MTKFDSIRSIAAGDGAVLLYTLVGQMQTHAEEDVLHLDSHLELFVDEYLIENMKGSTRKLNSPEPKGLVMIFNRPWERAGCVHFTLFQDGNIYRMYYPAAEPGSGTTDTYVHNFGNAEVTRYVERKDGIHWTRPDLNLFEGHNVDHYDAHPLRMCTPNNIVWPGQGQPFHFAHNFSPCKATNSACEPEARYKTVGRIYDWARRACSPSSLRSGSTGRRRRSNL